MREREREREHERGRGREKEEGTESEAGSRLRAVSTEPDAGLELMNREITTCAEVKCLTDWATQAPRFMLGFHFPSSHYILVSTTLTCLYICGFY